MGCDSQILPILQHIHIYCQGRLTSNYPSSTLRAYLEGEQFKRGCTNLENGHLALEVDIYPYTYIIPYDTGVPGIHWHVTYEYIDVDVRIQGRLSLHHHPADTTLPDPPVSGVGTRSRQSVVQLVSLTYSVLGSWISRLAAPGLQGLPSLFDEMARQRLETIQSPTQLP